MQIEKWIETLFPSQTAEEAQRRVKGQKSEADEAAAKESAEARSDVFFVLFVNLIILAFITSIMVSS